MPYWRLSGVYFFYFAVVGAMAPYWSLYLDSIGFDAHQIGLLAAIPMVTKLIAPNIWSYFSDRSGKRLLIMRLGSLGASLLFVGLIFLKDYISLIILLASYSIFWNAVLPQFEALTLRYLENTPNNYSKVRLWGSVGFIVTVLGLGAFFETFSIDWLPEIILFFLVGIFCFTLALPNKTDFPEKEGDIEFIGLVLRFPILIFYVVLFLLQFSHGVYYVFYSLYLESYGYSRSLIGLLWTIGVVAEIGIFIKMPVLLVRFSRVSLLSISLLLTSLRWFVIAQFPQSVSILAAAQLIHAFSFGVIHAVAIDFIREYFGESSQGQAQALYSAVSFGAGASLGAYISGLIWHLSPQMTFFIAAIAAFISWLLTIVFLKTRL